MNARWMVPAWSKRAFAHLSRPHPLNAEYAWWACGGMAASSMMRQDDGRPRCRKCEAARRKTKGASR